MAGMAMQAPMRKWLRTMGSLPVKVTEPPASSDPAPNSVMKRLNASLMSNGLVVDCAIAAGCAVIDPNAAPTIAIPDRWMNPAVSFRRSSFLPLAQSFER